MRTCPNDRCGEQVPPELDWCPHCRTYVRWEPTGTIPMLPEAPAGRPLAGPTGTPPMTPAVAREPARIGLLDADGEWLARPALRVQPGERLSVRVHIRNESGIADTFLVRLDGLPEDWWSAAPAALGSTNPEGELTVTLHPPRDASARAGRRELRFVALAGPQRAALAHADATLEIGRFDDVRASLAPARRSGRRRARYRLRVDNHGNAPAVVGLAASDDGERLRLEVQAPRLELDAGTGRETILLARPRRPRLVGAPVDHRITVSVAAPAGPMTATFTQRAWLPRWLRPAVPAAEGRVLSGYSVVLDGGPRTPIQGELTLGRAAGNQLRLADPAVSRRHARLIATGQGVEVHDLGSSSGTFLNGRRIAGCAVAGDGQRLRVGDTRLRVERDRADHEAAPTVVVPVGWSLHVDTCGRAADRVEPEVPLPARPRLRSGWARKRLAADEGERRFVLENLRTGRFLRFSAQEARLLDLLDGRLTVPELVRAVAAEQGESGVRRLLEVLAELAELGMLAGSEDEPPAPAAGWRRLLQPRELSLRAAPGIVAWLYRAGGRHLFSRPARALMAATIVLGALAFAAVVARGGVRPFHVDGRILLGSLAFIGGRLAVVAAHELGHALTLTAFGRRPRRIGVKLVLVLPYAFVDTSEAWYEPRRRRIAVSAAGPLTDVLLAGAFALVALGVAGSARDIAFQLALGAYMGALLNLNPLLERDGYHVLADLLREPNLRRRGREYVAGRLTGRGTGEACPRAIRIYGLMAVGWGVVAALFAGVIALRFVGRSIGDVRLAIGLGVLAFLLALVPTVVLVARPLRARRGRRTAGAGARSTPRHSPGGGRAGTLSERAVTGARVEATTGERRDL